MLQEKIVKALADASAFVLSQTVRKKSLRQIKLRSNITRRKANKTENDKFLSKLVVFFVLSGPNDEQLFVIGCKVFSKK